jgi:hypothetical protein
LRAPPLRFALRPLASGATAAAAAAGAFADTTTDLAAGGGTTGAAAAANFAQDDPFAPESVEVEGAAEDSVAAALVAGEFSCSGWDLMVAAAAEAAGVAALPDNEGKSLALKTTGLTTLAAEVVLLLVGVLLLLLLLLLRVDAWPAAGVFFLEALLVLLLGRLLVELLLLLLWALLLALGPVVDVDLVAAAGVSTFFLSVAALLLLLAVEGALLLLPLAAGVVDAAADSELLFAATVALLEVSAALDGRADEALAFPALLLLLRWAGRLLLLWWLAGRLLDAALCLVEAAGVEWALDGCCCACDFGGLVALRELAGTAADAVCVGAAFDGTCGVGVEASAQGNTR